MYTDDRSKRTICMHWLSHCGMYSHLHCGSAVTVEWCFLYTLMRVKDIIDSGN